MGSDGDTMLGGGDFDVCLSDVLTQKILKLSEDDGRGIEQDDNNLVDCDFDNPGKDSMQCIAEGVVVILASILFLLLLDLAITTSYSINLSVCSPHSLLLLAEHAKRELSDKLSTTVSCMIRKKGYNE